MRLSLLVIVSSALAAGAVGCGIDESLFNGGVRDAGTPGDATTVDVADGSMQAGDSSSTSEGGSDDSGMPADTGSFYDGPTTCGDAGVGLGGNCVGLLCCPQLFVCTGAGTCQPQCRPGPCSSSADCCLGTFCSDAGMCTCQPLNASCTRDTDCCSVAQGGGCDNHGDAGRACTSN